MILLAMDRAPSVRSFDADGRLHVARSNISKANVCPYLGREIPNWETLGLDGDSVYQLLRDPEELARGAATFNNLQVLSEHVPVTSWDDESHMAEITVGSTGTDAAFIDGYLTNSLVVWARRSIDGIERDEQRELSSAYRYRADMTPGEYNGVAYDGIMRDIIGNHVALVFEGRAGPDVLVGDEQPMAFKSKRALMVAGSLSGLLRPHLAADAKLDISGALAGLTDQTIKKDGAVKALADRVFGLVQPQLAADAALTVADVTIAIDAASDMPLGEDEDPDVAEDVDPDVAEDEDPDVAEDEDPDDKPAMDAATVKALVEKGRKSALAEAAAIRTAEREVTPVTGELAVAFDSAADVYQEGLKALGVDLTGLPRSSFAATFRAVHASRSAAPKVAQDAAAVGTARDNFNKRFPNRATILKGV